MPPRIARSSVQAAGQKSGKNKGRKRNLDAFAIASHSAPEKNKVKSHRLGEFLDDRPKQKRRRDDEDEKSDEEGDASTKRRRAAPQDEDEEEGSDSSGNEWTMGGLKEDDSDSDIDSDDAFGESDEEKFEGFTFRGSTGGNGKKSSKPAKKQPQVDQGNQGGIDLDEEGSAGEDEEEDDFGEEGVDLATMLDDDDEEVLGGKDTTRQDMGEESASEEDEDDKSDMQADSESSEDEEDQEERVARMRDRIDALDASTQPSKKTQSSSQPAALTVEDLLADLDPAQKKQFASALKTKKKSQQPKTLTAPLPKRQQDKLNREEASKKAKEQLDRWRDTVIRNRRAEFLSFPLKDPNSGERMGTDRFVVGDEQTPANELEENIRKIMEESGLATKPGQKQQDDEEMLVKAEELATNKLPVEEVMQRRAELRRARELLFREELKAKRIKKIKSKAYRRVHRKERLRQERENELYGDPDIDEDEQEKFERKRAEARMSTKHKDSKFAKSLNQTNRAAWDDGAREAVIDEARRREDLKRRIHGDEISDDNSGKSDVLSDDDDDDQDEDAGTLKTLDKLSRQDEDAQAAKGLAGLKFMRAADDRRRAQNEEDMQRLRKDLAVEDGDEEESDDAIDDQGLGRAIFGPKGKEGQNDRATKKTRKPEMEEGEESADEDGDEEHDVEIVTVKPNSGTKNGKGKSSTVDTEPKNAKSKTSAASGSAGGWLRDAEPEGPSQASQGSWLSGKAKKDKNRKAPDNAAIINTDLNGSSGREGKDGIRNSKAKSQGKKESTQNDTEASNTNGWIVVKHSQNDDDSDQGEPSDPILTAAQQKSDLQRRAFAIDDAIKTTFDAEKVEAEESEGEKEISNHLPGWGSWAGHGLSKADKKANAHKKHNPLYKTKVAGIKKEDRKDAKLENVIISEKQNRKGKGYLAPILPHGFETKAQYERSLRLPMGPEWSTKEVHQRATRPRVVVKPGAVVEAMERPLV